MEIKQKGHKLVFEDGMYKLFIDGNFIIEDEDIDYVLSYFKKEDDNKKKAEVW